MKQLVIGCTSEKSNTTLLEEAINLDKFNSILIYLFTYTCLFAPLQSRSFCAVATCAIMAPLSSFQVVECKTIDGIIIRGRFYAVDGKAPAIIMTPGVRRADILDCQLS